MSDYNKDLHLHKAVLKKDNTLADFTGYAKFKVAQPDVADVYAPTSEEKKIVSTVGHVDALLAGAKFLKDVSADLKSFAGGVKSATPSVPLPHAPADDKKDIVATVDYVSKTLNGADLTTSKADFSSFANGVKVATPELVNFLSVPEDGVKNNAATVHYVAKALEDALATTVAGNKVSRIAQVENRLNTFLTSANAGTAAVDTLTELITAISNLDSGKTNDLLTTFNTVSARLTNFENLFQQTEESIAHATFAEWPAVSKLTTDATFQLDRPTGRGFPVLKDESGANIATTYALVGTSSLVVSSVSPAGLVTLASPAVAGTFTVSATNSVKRVTTIVTIAAPAAPATIAWTLESIPVNGTRTLTAPAGISGTVPDNYYFTLAGKANDSDPDISMNIYGLVTASSTTGSRTVQIKDAVTLAVLASATLTVTAVTPPPTGNMWSIMPRTMSSSQQSYTLTNPTQAEGGDGTSVGWTYELVEATQLQQSNNVNFNISISGSSVTVPANSRGMRTINAYQGGALKTSAIFNVMQ